MKNAGKGLRFGVLVPCRNEQALIERKLRNLFQLQWPAANGPHRLLLIDDHSTDATVALIEERLDELEAANLDAVCLANAVRPGKNGALETGLDALQDSVDVIVISDADVVLEPTALVALQEAFEQDEALGMACATQAFVKELPADGSCPGTGGASLQSASEPWDRATRAVRRLESRFGKLFSVHGQWLAWRADLALRPAPGVAADDVDLMLQARCSSRPRVRMLPGMTFFECKPAATDAQETQALRRARAWFQVFARSSALRDWRGVDALQGRLYSSLPACAPWLLLGMLLALPVIAFLFAGWLGAVLCLVLLAVLALTPSARAWARTLRVIVQARRLERREAMPEAWDMLRE